MSLLPQLSYAPSGWFLVADSAEIPREALVARRLCGQDLVLFRTASGALHALDGHCPHLGAPFAPGGRVEGEGLVCGYHDFCFDGSGACVRTGYGTKPPPTARVKSWPVAEKERRVFVWHGPGAPAWEAPDVPLDGWLRGPVKVWNIAAHPQDLAENGVDLGHFTANHKYRDVVLEDSAFDGPILRATYAFTRANPYGPGDIRVRIHIRLFGLGFYDVEGRTAPYGLDNRFQISATPLEDGRSEVRLYSFLRPLASSRTVHPVLSLIPAGLLSRLILRLAYGAAAHDVAQDFPFVQGKKFLERPALAAGDGPIGPFRRWTRQFYGQPESAVDAA